MHYPVRTYGGMEVQLHSFLTSVPRTTGGHQSRCVNDIFARETNLGIQISSYSLRNNNKNNAVKQTNKLSELLIRIQPTRQDKRLSYRTNHKEFR
jgi:hypothetical protein